MNGWVKPAEALMGSLRFPAKFTLVSILFLIPLCLTVVLYWQVSSQNIDRLQRELDGMAFISELEPVLIQTGRHRGLTHALLNGDAGIQGTLSQVRSELERELSKLGQMASVDTVPGNVKQSVATLQQQWRALRGQAEGGDAEAIFEAHNTQVKHIRELFITVSRAYALELDSDAQTTFLINMAVLELPLLFDESAKLRDAATGVAAKGRFTPDSFIYLSNQLNQVAGAAPVLIQSSQQTFSFQSGAQLQDELTAAGQQLSRLQDFVRIRVIEPDSVQISADAVFEQGSANLAPMIKLYSHMMPMLHMLIEKRLVRLELYRNLVLGVILLAVGAAIYLFMGFYRYTLGTVNRFSKMAALLAVGDLSVRLESRGSDEMSTVTEGFNQVADGFQRLVRQTVESTDVVATAAHTMNAESSETLQGAAQQKREAVQIAQAVQELAHSAEDIAGHSAVAAESAQQADALATQGREVVEHTAQSFTGMLDEVSRTSQVIGQLDTDVQAIGDISRVIREIAEQTNLLALNAAIEAARAGEQGRGFAVVADEVRNLAQRTQSSTQEIEQTIESLQACTRDSVALMTSSHQQVSTNVEEITRAGELLGEIDSIVAGMNQKNAQIALAVQAQNQLVDRLQGNIASVSGVADSTELSAQQSAELAQSMAESSARLRDTLGAFKVS